MRTLANRRAEGGMAVVAVMVLISVLFFGGAVMALAVSSNLHTVDIITAQDAVDYAAESAVVRGIAASDDTCSPSGSLTVGSEMINHQSWAFWCHGADESAIEPTGSNQIDGIGRWATAGQQLGTCASISLPSAVAKMTAWTVIGWRGAGQLQAWMDTNESCSSQVAANCDQKTVTADVIYVRCRVGLGNPFLHLDGRDLNVGPSIIRWAATGGGGIRTIVGISGPEVDEADALGSRQVLWNTVLP